MDAAELRRKAQAAREFEVHCDGGRKYKVRLPTRHQFMLMLHAAQQSDSNAAMFLVERMALCGNAKLGIEPAIIGWQGINEGQIYGDEKNDAPLVWSAEIVDLVLDAFPEDHRLIAERMDKEIALRTERIEAAKKKSAS